MSITKYLSGLCLVLGLAGACSYGQQTADNTTTQ